MFRNQIRLAFAIITLVWATNEIQAGSPDMVSDAVRTQILALEREKAKRSHAQHKMDSQLIYAAKRHRGETIAEGVPDLEIDLRYQADGRVLVDIDAEISPELQQTIAQLGGQVVCLVPRFRSLRALMPVHQIESLTARKDVTFVRRAVLARTHTGSVNSKGDVTHGVTTARATFRSDGSGIKVGVLSDSVDYLATSQASGDLGTVTILSGQSGTGSGNTGEGTAMLEIVHDLAPGAALYFATAFNSEASFAQNILDLRAAGCDIIVDDVGYLDEPVFQDGIVAQAVNSVTASGALYFSAAGNGGNLTHGTSGTWEGDFVDGGASGSPLSSSSGRLHSFGSTTTNTLTTVGSSARADLFWSDPWGASTNDYDLYVLNASGTSIKYSSTATQNGTQNPYEYCSAPVAGYRILVVKYSGAARFLHLETGDGVLSINTSGNTRGHPCASNAFAVAAVSALTAYPNAFTGGSSNPVEAFSSDGPRRIFYDENGMPFTPGNFLATGGRLLHKPDIAAADGVQTSVKGFSSFYGTSAAAPHAAAIAALLWSYNRLLTPASIRSVLTNATLDIEATGVDRDSGAGILMAPAALQAVPGAPQVTFVRALLTDLPGGNGNGNIDPGEEIRETLVWTNLAGVTASNVTATLQTGASGVTLRTSSAAFPDLAVGSSVSNSTPFSYCVDRRVPAGSMLTFTSVLRAAGNCACTGTFTRIIGQAVNGPTTTNVFTVSSLALAIPDLTTIYATNPVSVGTGYIDDVKAAIRLNHTYDSDLTIAVQHPDGTEVILANARGSSGDNFGIGYPPAPYTNTVFDDAATTAISAGSAPFAGSYRPDGLLSTFDGKPVSGAWRFRVTDAYSSDIGTLYACSLTIAWHSVQYAATLFNNAPVSSNQTLTVNSGFATNIFLHGSDLDGDPLTYHTNSLPLHGTLSAFNANSGAIVYTATPGYSGTDSFAFITHDGITSSTTATITLNVAVQYATNGVPYWWLAAYVLTNGGFDVNALADPDHDGVPTWAEYVAQTDPTNADSFLRIIQFDNGSLAFTPVSTGRIYSIEETGYLGSSNWLPGTALHLGTGSVMRLSLTNAQPIRFYRVRVQIP